MKQKILLLGSTGSIGTQTLEVLKLFPSDYSVAGLSVNKNIVQLKEQCDAFKVDTVHIYKKEAAEQFLRKNSGIKVFSGIKGLTDIVEQADFDILVNALSGEVGIGPTRVAVRRGKTVALANKETLVAAGEEIMKLAREKGSEIRPIDSEHSAIWQCLRGEEIREVSRIILTCSGGPFRDAKKWPLAKLAKVTAEEALRHPNWDMGTKITIDSATLMNKALEVIEAVRLFEISPEKIEVVVHPQSIIHSAVEFQDGSVMAQMGLPDMRTAISLALSAPGRHHLPFKKFNFLDSPQLSFEPVDKKRFPSIELARKALQKDEKACAIFNKANERAVADFLDGKIGFLDIFEIIRRD